MGRVTRSRERTATILVASGEVEPSITFHSRLNKRGSLLAVSPSLTDLRWHGMRSSHYAERKRPVPVDVDAGAGEALTGQLIESDGALNECAAIDSISWRESSRRRSITTED